MIIPINAKKKTLATIALAVTVLINSFTCFNNTHAALSGTGHTRLKNFIYAAGAYQCFADNEGIETNDGSLMADSIGINADVGNIIKSDSQKMYVGSWVDGADGDGMMTCKALVQKMFASMRGGSGAPKITQSDVTSGLLKNVYTMSTVQSNGIYCNYAIVNKEETEYWGNGTIYTWPQGYIDNASITDYLNRTSASKVAIVYNDNGIQDLAGYPSDPKSKGMNPRIMAHISSHSFNLDNPEDLCKSFVSSIGVWLKDGSEDKDDQANYTAVLSFTRGDPFNGIHLFDGISANRAVLFNDENSKVGNHFSATRATTSSTTSAEKVKANGYSYAATGMIKNIKNNFFNGKTPKDYLSGEKSLNYMLVGRYLYNGDGKGGSNCNGLSVENTPDNVSKLDKNNWDTSLSTVATTSAYGNSGTSKKSYLTHIKDPKKTVILGPWDYDSGANALTCYNSSGGGDLVSKFNSITITAISAGENAARSAVQGYISPMTAEEANAAAAGVGTDDTTEPTCMNTAGTSLGWILCPVLETFGNATEWAYDELVEPALKIEPQLFTGKGDSTRDAWRTFRDIANIFFIILFLAVIFSQLTGVGIDNYGIKKILPKLIVAAILINLSYIICVICIDTSNILGNGLRNIFVDLGSQLKDIPNSVKGVSLGDVAGGTMTAITVLIALIGGVAAAITAAGGVVAFLVSLLVIALSAVIALFFLFLLLSAREAAIVILTVLSPLAFACYILPNTQNIFKKWYQLGWRLLMVYPIAGLLIGGGDYVSKLLLKTGGSDQGFFFAFTAVIVGIVPIFFIPTVLKQAFALMGGLGAKISGFGKSVGSKVSGDVDKSIRGSERFKNYQADRERNRKLGYARRTNRRLSERMNNGETLSRRQRNRLAQARLLEGAEYENELKRNAIVDGNRYETMRAGIEAKSRDEAINDRLALMQKNGVNGGAYNLENMKARMQNLEESSRTRALTDDEKGEMAALARGMTSKQGGASMLSSVIRQSGSNGKSNSNFMSAMGEIYSNDSTVANKMAEKDAAASAYTEKFLPNSAGYGSDFTAYKGTEDYGGDLKKRIKSYSAGLNQGGAAVTDYVNSLSKSDLQAIMNDETLRNSLDTDVREAVERRAGDLNVQRAARQVEIAGENQVFDVHSLDSDTLLDIATNPKMSDNNPNRAAAVEELNKRGIK